MEMLAVVVAIGYLCVLVYAERVTINENHCGVVFQTRVINGKRAKEGMFPWMVRLSVHQEPGSDEGTCGGTIITRWHILTAAHCVFSKGHLHHKMKALYGSVQTSSPTTQTAIVQAVTVHKDFSEKTFQNDIAIIKVAKPFQFSMKVRPICLNLDDTDLTGREVVVAGWGIQKPKTQPSDKLRYTKLKVLSHSECRERLKTYEYDEEIMICAFQEDTDACQGDSGSGVTFSNNTNTIQAAIVSHGVGCTQVPGVYVPVHVYRDWILNTIKDDSAFQKAP